MLEVEYFTLFCQLQLKILKSKNVNLSYDLRSLAEVVNFVIFSISGLVGSCIAVLVIAVFFESLKSYKVHRQKPCRRSSEKTPLIRKPHKIQRRYLIMGIKVLLWYYLWLSDVMQLEKFSIRFPSLSYGNQSKS